MLQAKSNQPDKEPTEGELPAPKLVTPSNAEQLAALQLLKIEGEIRDAASLHELLAAVANLSRGLMRARQMFVAQPSGDGFAFKAISGLPAVERSAPAVSWLELVLARAHKDVGLATALQFKLEAYTDRENRSALSFPFQEAIASSWRGS